MRHLLALIVTVLLALAVVACGGSAGKVTSSDLLNSHSPISTYTATTTVSSRGAPSGGYLKGDEDYDADDEPHSLPAESDDDPLLQSYGKQAGPDDARAVTALVKDYLTAAVTDDSAMACSMLDSSVVAGLSAGQSQSERNARQTCAAALSSLFKQQHQGLIADEVATMVVTSVHVRGNLGLAALGFTRRPQAQIIVKREGGAWKIDTLLANNLT